MNALHTNWKNTIERLWADPAIDWNTVVRVVADIAAESDDPMLRQTATQGLPLMRQASAARAGRAIEGAAHRRLSAVRDVLHMLTAPRFGKRGVVRRLSPEQQHREMLGLPLNGHLSGPEIHHAFKRAAKSLHPDAGGDTKAFLDLSDARDALMHPHHGRDG